MTQQEPPSDDQVLGLLLEGLSVLDLGEVRRVLEQSLADPGTDSRLAWLWRLFEPQVRRRIEGRVERRYRYSRLPERKTLAAYDFAFQPSLNRDLVMELNTLRFADQGRNVLLAGMSGTGKSHIAKALGFTACMANRRVRYTTSADMLSRLNASLADDTLALALRPYVRAELLVIDEIGLEQVERKEASRSGLVQKVLLPRYNENRSTVITSNIPWEAWADYLDDQLGATALLDRLIHRSHVIVINGPSYRDHEHRKETEQANQARPHEVTPVATDATQTATSQRAEPTATTSPPPAPARSAKTARGTNRRRGSSRSSNRSHSRAPRG